MAKLGAMFVQYSHEENNYEVFATEYGYFTYLVQGDELFVETIFISPEFRKTRKSLELLENMRKLALGNGCSFISGTTYLLDEEKDSPKFTRKARLLIDAGFEMKRVKDKTIIWYKEV